MIYEEKFMDIGKVSVLECVQSETKRRPCLLTAIGEKGEMTFAAIVAYSKAYPEDCKFHAKLFDLGVAAFFSQMRLQRNAVETFRKMKRGERFVMGDDKESLKKLRESGLDSYGVPSPCRRWINSHGESVDEPRDFLARHLAAALCTLSHEVYTGRESVDGYMEGLLSIGSATIGAVSGSDVDFMLDWHDKLESVARTINHHLDVGDCSPNMSKIDQLLALYAKRQQLVDRLADIDTFAAHLNERMMQVYESRSSGWKRRIDTVEPFRCARFPGTRHV